MCKALSMRCLEAAEAEARCTLKSFILPRATVISFSSAILSKKLYHFLFLIERG